MSYSHETAFYFHKISKQNNVLLKSCQNRNLHGKAKTTYSLTLNPNEINQPEFPLF